MASLSISQEKRGTLDILNISGRLDGHGAIEAAPFFDAIRDHEAIILDLSGVTYLSSAGIRLFVTLQKKLSAQSGQFVIAGPQPYCREVLRVAGLDQFFTIFADIDEAVAELSPKQDSIKTPCGNFVFHHGSNEKGGIEVLGKIQHVLEASITPERVRARHFSAKEYSLGLGALGPSVEEVMPLIGEMMTIGGTMVWLPTDGNDTPDFLIPHHDSDTVVIRTGFNASLAGEFNEYVEFESASPEGTTLEDLYEALFVLSRQRRPDYRGALGLAMRAEVGEVYGSGVVKAPIASQAPANGKLITDPSNYSTWFEADVTPRHRDVTALICGTGLDLDADLSVFNQEHLNSTFYTNPGNDHGAAHVRLHNHGVFFKPFPLGEKPWSLEREIQSVVEEGVFVDMRHLFDKTTIIWALIGIVYVQDFAPDAAMSPQV